ncbi:MAG: alpha/beta hydrolase [Burkholderiaceae bacterium]|nr:alpha/beta hydrolase [Burkholderiaceae bacterium]
MFHETIFVDERPIHVEGDGKETIIMIHGWPDTEHLWVRQVAALAPHHRCVHFTLPGFEPGAKRETFSIDALCAFIGRVINAVSQDAPVVLLLHDWGCVFGYQFQVRHPERVSRIIGVDVGDSASLRREASTKLLLMVLTYQLWLAVAWMTGGRIGNWMTYSMARLLRCPTIGPQVVAQQAYPYYMTWLAGSGSYRSDARPFEPACPMLYIYGTRKPLMFHAASWLARLRQNPGNRILPFETGHWVMVEKPEAFNEAVLKWLAVDAPVEA